MRSGLRRRVTSLGIAVVICLIATLGYWRWTGQLPELVLKFMLGRIKLPPGFTIPFFYYDQFLRENKLDDAIYQMLNDQKFVHDPAYRRAYLTRMREQIQRGTMNPQLRAEALRRLQAEFGTKGVFARSSTNSEDLPNFNGAGLYSTQPNVRATQRRMPQAIVYRPGQWTRIPLARSDRRHDGRE